MRGPLDDLLLRLPRDLEDEELLAGDPAGDQGGEGDTMSKVQDGSSELPCNCRTINRSRFSPLEIWLGVSEESELVGGRGWPVVGELAARCSLRRHDTAGLVRGWC